MRRRGSTGDLERLGKRRRQVISVGDIVPVFATLLNQRRPFSGDDDSKRGLVAIGRKLSVLAKLPKSDLANPRFVDFVERIEILEDALDNDRYEKTTIKIPSSQKYLTVVQTGSQFRDAFQVLIGGSVIFSTSTSLNGYLRCRPSEWVELERTCFSTTTMGGASFLLRCLAALFANSVWQISEHLDLYADHAKYLCYPFFYEWRLHLTNRLCECLGPILIPDLVPLLVDYSCPSPTCRDEFVWRTQHAPIHEQVWQG